MYSLISIIVSVAGTLITASMAAPLQRPGSVPESYNGYSRIQCWRDSTISQLPKNMLDTRISSHEMTVEECIDGCASVGHPSAGIVLGRECFCGNIPYDARQAENISECDFACNEEATEHCGGSDRILVYHKRDFSASETHRGIIEISREEDDKVLGYLSNNRGGQVGIVSEDEADAIIITFEAPRGAISVTQAELSYLGWENYYAFFGLSMGSVDHDNNIGTGDPDYLFVGGVNHTAPGAVPQKSSPEGKAFESSVWNIDLETGAMAAQWINDDGSAPSTTLSLYAGYYLFAHGDLETFNVNWDEYNPAVKLKFLPRSSVTYTGIVQISREDNDEVLGYVANNLALQMGVIIPNIDNAGIVTFESPSGGSVSKAEVAFLTPLNDFPLFGLSVGTVNQDHNVEMGDYDYLYVGGAHHSVRGASPQYRPNEDRAFESSVWNIDLKTGAMTAQWTNDGGVAYDLTLSLHQGTYILGHADLDAFNTHFATSQFPIKFTFLPRS